MENALGMACAQASGLNVNHGTSSKSFQAGRSAMSGVMAATLARDGFTAARDGIEADSGFYSAYRRDNEVDEVEFFGRLGNPYNVIDPGVRLKIFPNSSLTHTALEAVLQLVEEHAIVPEAVQSVHVSLPPPRGKGAAKDLHLGTAMSHPKTGLEAKFSMPFCVAVALVYGPPQLGHFTDEAVRDPRLLPLLDRVTVSGDEVTTAEAPLASTVRITLKNGQVLTQRADYPKGHRRNPVTAKDIDQKFFGCSRGVLSADKAAAVVSQFRDLDNLPDVQPVFERLSGGDES
jgi:2-methylcitrate dehydratase PrpD